MTQRLKVVLVDDDPSLCYAIKDSLNNSEEFIVVGVALNGHEAIKIIERENPDIVILDIIMPKADGLEVLCHFKDNKDIDFVVLSAVEHDLITRKAIELGAMYYLMKPFDSIELLNKLKALFIGNITCSKLNVISSSTYYKAIENVLFDLGVPMHIKGYRYIYQGVYQIVQMDSEAFKITREIYPDLASQFETTVTSVEKAIRSAIDLTLSRGNMEYIKSYFSKELFNDKITNKAFMVKIATEIKKMI